MSWRITMKDDEGMTYTSTSLRTRIDAMIFASDVSNDASIISIGHTSGEQITIDELGDWKLQNRRLLDGRSSRENRSRNAWKKTSEAAEAPTPEEPAHGRQLQEHHQSQGLPQKTEDTGMMRTTPSYSATDPAGLATDAVEAMDAAIRKHRRSKLLP